MNHRAGLLVLVVFFCGCFHRTSGVSVSDAEAERIGQKIWMNEGGGKLLIWWDDICQCPSLGINNYLWYQADRPRVFDAPFPDLLDFMQKRGARVPKWLESRPPAPWTDKESYLKEAANSPRMDELRVLLRSTIALQARYSADRLEKALPKMLEIVPQDQREAIRRQFYRVAASTNGFYALVDYVNFKGEGVSPKERYFDKELGRDEGWGLLQVLMGMKGEACGPAALDEFSASAETVLKRRVKNAPDQTPDAAESPHHKDERWLPIWLRRVRTYKAGG